MRQRAVQVPTSARIFVAGHRGLVGSAIVRRLEAAGCTRDPHGVARPARSARPGGGELLVQGPPAGVRVPRGRHRRRHPGQQHPPGRVHLRQPDDPRARWSRAPASTASPSCCTSGRAASTRARRRSRSSRRRCSPDRWSRPTRPTRWPRSPASSCASRTARQYGCNFISAMPTNLYGPGDNFDLTSSHVLPALIRKFHEAKLGGREEVEIWGTGSAMREFLHVDDLADACVFLMDHYDGALHLNVGTGEDLSIQALAELVGVGRASRRRAALRHLQARRHAAQAARRRPPARARLAASHRAGRRPAQHLRLVPAHIARRSCMRPERCRCRPRCRRRDAHPPQRPRGRCGRPPARAARRAGPPLPRAGGRLVVRVHRPEPHRRHPSGGSETGYAPFGFTSASTTARSASRSPGAAACRPMPRAAVLNVTATNPSAPGWVKVVPTGSVAGRGVEHQRRGPGPDPGQPGHRPAAHVGPDAGQVDISCYDPLDVVVDVAGAYVPATSATGRGRYVGLRQVVRACSTPATAPAAPRSAPGRCSASTCRRSSRPAPPRWSSTSPSPSRTAPASGRRSSPGTACPRRPT